MSQHEHTAFGALPPSAQLSGWIDALTPQPPAPSPSARGDRTPRPRAPLLIPDRHGEPASDRAARARATLGVGVGMPQDRLARLAARQAFVELRQVFMEAAAQCDIDEQGRWLREQVRLAEDPLDLWKLHAPLVDALDETEDHGMVFRRRLLQGLRERFVEATPAQLAGNPG